MAVAVFQQSQVLGEASLDPAKKVPVLGEVVFHQTNSGVSVEAVFTKLPPGLHGFHIHVAGDLRGEGCQGACSHWHKGRRMEHGGPPGHKGPRHTGDLGNLELKEGQDQIRKTYFLKGVRVEELYGRSMIVHADEDDYGRGSHEDSKTTGHSGARIACAIIGRQKGCSSATRKRRPK